MTLSQNKFLHIQLKKFTNRFQYVRFITCLHSTVEKEVVKEVVKEVKVENNREVRVENLVFVTFAQGKSLLTKEAMDALNTVKAGSHVQIVGTASPEGDPELNQRLSQARADAVAAYLKDRGVIVDEALGKGVQGNTSNRLAIVYVK